jgi:Trypsin-co-occurring domain 1
MTQLLPIRFDNDTIIYIEATEDVIAPEVSIESPADDEEEESLVDKGRNVEEVRQQMVQNFKAVEHTIRAYTVYTLNAFKKIEIADISKVTLEFGLEVGGEAGIPYVTKGTAKSNLKITVECSFDRAVSSTPPA